MRIAIATIQSPFIYGGADSLAKNLHAALIQHGHQVETITLPFRFFPDSWVKRCMQAWEQEDFAQLNGYTPDLVIPLMFPAFYVQHSNKVVWLLHQFRRVYDLWDALPSTERTDVAIELRALITERDTHHLRQANRIATISGVVSQRLKRYNGLDSTPVYHPPPFAERIYTAAYEPFILVPSRLQANKRQRLFVEAMRYTRTPVTAVVAGFGDPGEWFALNEMVDRYGLKDRVRMMGRATDAELITLYAHCLGVFFGPRDEDLGYVTLEAMLAKKAVITCTDSGGPLEFVVEGETGFVAPPEPQAIAERLDWLYLHRRRAIEMGEAGGARYAAMDISWSNAVKALAGT